MAWTSFESHRHGFLFVNGWEFSEEERQRLHKTFAKYLKWSTILGATALGPAGAILAPRGVRALRDTLESRLAPGYGLCGGMCFTALDFLKAGLSIPQGEHREDRPAPGTRLRSYLWQRQIDSFVSDGARFVSWLIFLNYVPSRWPFRGGSRWLLDRSRKEWEKLKAFIDAGEPVPVGLVRDTENLFANHQVLAVGYDEEGEARGTIHLYDPNCPGEVPAVRFEFGEHSLEAQESCGALASLRGFFCESYSFSDPSEVVSQAGDGDG